MFSGGPDNAFSPNSVIKVWDLEAGKEILTLRGHTQAILSLVPSLDGKRLASTSGDGSIRVWDLETGTEVRLLRGHPAGGDEGQLFPLALSADGKRIFSGGQDNKINVWDVDTGKEFLALPHEGGILSLALSDDGKRLISGSGDHTIKVWDLEADKEIQILRGSSGDVGSLALSGDSKRLFSGGGFFFGDNAIKVWDLATGQELLSLPGHPGGVACLALSGDARLLVSVGRDGAVKIWDFDPGSAPINPNQRGREHDVVRDEERHYGPQRSSLLCYGLPTVAPGPTDRSPCTLKHRETCRSGAVAWSGNHATTGWRQC